MKIAIATPILFDKNSPFNHLLKDIIEGFLCANYEVDRHVAVRNDLEDSYKFDFNTPRIHYITYKRRDCSRGNILARYIIDSLTNIREARGVKRSNADVLFEDVSYSSFWTIRAAKKKGIKVVAMLQDVWPDNAVQTGLIKDKGILYRFFEHWQQYVYKNANRIICISDDMKQFVVEKGVEDDLIDVVYNWGYNDDIVSIPWEKNDFVKEYQLNQDMFYAIYAGNIGKMQNVEVVVEAAKILQRREDIHFLIIGDGVRKKTIEKIATGMKNLTILPFQPSSMATHIYSAAGVNIIPLIGGGTKTALPSKTGIILSCGKPVLMTFGEESSFAKKMKEFNAGYSVDSNDSIGLAKMIECIKDRHYYMDGGLTVFKQFFLREKNVRLYSQILKDTVESDK